MIKEIIFHFRTPGLISGQGHSNVPMTPIGKYYGHSFKQKELPRFVSNISDTNLNSLKNGKLLTCVNV